MTGTETVELPRQVFDDTVVEIIDIARGCLQDDPREAAEQGSELHETADLFKVAARLVNEVKRNGREPEGHG